MDGREVAIAVGAVVGVLLSLHNIGAAVFGIFVIALLVAWLKNKPRGRKKK